MKKIFIVLLVAFTLVLCGCGHKHEYTEKVVAPTCTEGGYTEFTCECGDTYKDAYTEATGHTFGEWTTVKESTETEKGSKSRECACGEKETEELPLKEHVHSFGEWVVIIESTETETGYQERECACGAKDREELPLKEHEHSFGEWVIVEKSTVTTKGYKERECACGEKETEELPLNLLIVDGTTEEGHYETFASALEVAQEGAVIIFAAGEYTEDVTINIPNVIIKGPNVDVNANTGTRVEEAVIKGVITLTSQAGNITFDGLAFTAGAKICYNESVAFDGFIFQNNKVYDTNETETAWDETRYMLPGFIQFKLINTGSISNVQILNNSFVNVSETNVLTNRVINMTVDGNVFKDFDMDAIRTEGGHCYGNLTFTNNVFEQTTAGNGMQGIFLYSVAGSTDEEKAIVLIENNKFINLGQDNGTVFSGAVGAYRFQEHYTTITVKNNIFDHCYDYLYLRNNGGDSSNWFCTVENNQFLGLPHNHYYGSYRDSDTQASNPHLAVFTTNYYEDNDGNVITDLSAYADFFKHMSSYGTALSTKPAA